jgi:CMP-N,N'-diacetyllegionaminic acid synthase
MDPLVIITARGGSKGVPDKNIKLLGGKPLIAYTIEAALGVFPAERIIVSTDSEKIKQAAEKCGIEVPFLRPAELATDTASSYDVILHAMDQANQLGIIYDTVILLQPTSPFRNAQHIRGALALLRENDDMVVSVKVSEENPYYSLFEENSDGYLSRSKEGSFTRRQDCPNVFSYNGAIYVMRAESLRKETIGSFKKVRKYVMSDLESLDIDTPLDWKLAELIMKEGLI